MPGAGPGSSGERRRPRRVPEPSPLAVGVAGDWSAAEIATLARNSPDGFYHFNAVSGDALSAQLKGGNIYIYDESGNAGRITTADVDQSNGVIHVLNSVLVPE